MPPDTQNTLGVVPRVSSQSVVGALAGAAHQLERALAGRCCVVVARRESVACMSSRRVADFGPAVSTPGCEDGGSAKRMATSGGNPR